LTAPRAAAIFGQLTANDNWFAHRGTVADQTDITDSDGIVYRYFSGRGFEFHPLGNFAALNATVASKNVAATTRLATSPRNAGEAARTPFSRMRHISQMGRCPETVHMWCGRLFSDLIAVAISC